MEKCTLSYINPLTYDQREVNHVSKMAKWGFLLERYKVTSLLICYQKMFTIIVKHLVNGHLHQKTWSFYTWQTTLIKGNKRIWREKQPYIHHIFDLFYALARMSVFEGLHLPQRKDVICLKSGSRNLAMNKMPSFWKHFLLWHLFNRNNV